MISDLPARTVAPRPDDPAVVAASQDEANRPVPFVVGALVETGGRVLMVRHRENTPWTLPMDRLRWKERMYDGALRVVLTQSGYTCKPVDLLSNYETFGQTLHAVIMMWRCDIVPGGAPGQASAAAVEWMDKNRALEVISQRLMAPTTIEVLRDLGWVPANFKIQ